MQVTRKGIFSSNKICLPVLFLWLTGLLFACPQAGKAQSGGVTITTPDTTAFPTVSFYMEAASGGAFIEGLGPANVRVIENERELPAAAVAVQQPGLQWIVAYNLSPAFTTRQGGNVYQKIQANLQTWAKAQPAQTPDDFTLIANERLLAIRQAGPARWADELAGYQPDLATMKAGLSSLSQALDIATDPNPRPNMKRALLYITAPPADNQLSALPNLTQRVSQMGLRVFVWAVVPSVDAGGKGLDALQKLADSSQGQLFLYTGAETLPDIETYLRPLRSIYQVSYQSAIQQSGDQRLAVSIVHGSQTLAAAPQTFKLEVQPPNPMFLEPPVAIERKGNSNGGQQAQPDSVDLRIIIEFPDGHPRPVTHSALYVDGKVVAENKTAPFEQFTWDLAGYDNSQRHLIQVKVEDSLGLTRASLEIPVDVQVETSGVPRLSLPVNMERLVVGSAVSLSALALVLVLWVSGRKGWFAERRRRKRIFTDPVTQPVRIQQIDLPRPNALTGVGRASWPLPSALVRKAPAWLLQLDESNQPISGHTILFVRREMTFGSNAQMASCVLNFPGIDELHARLILDPDGKYILADAGSVAGTWVNYCPVTQTGAILRHGDLIHFGQAAFRFELADPGPIRQLQVEHYQDQG